MESRGLIIAIYYWNDYKRIYFYAITMAKDAIEAWIITALRYGDEIQAIDGCYLQYAIDEIQYQHEYL